VLERRTEPPQMYQVVMLNDDYTPMEFVIVVLQEFFSKDREQATQIMLKIHLDGKGVCGVYSRDVAATKVDQVLDAAQGGATPCNASVSLLNNRSLIPIYSIPSTQAQRSSHDCPGTGSQLAHGLC
jgi:ATP-dependent Clp protease adaptor protein ClpS